MAVEIGNKYTYLRVIKDTEKRTKNRNKIFLCKCKCGKLIEVPSGSLITGNTKSCGCLKIVSAKNNGKKQRNLNNYKLNSDFGIGYTKRGKPFFFDLEDYDKIKNYTWNYNDQGYVIASEFGKIIRMHILIMSPPKGKEVDHIYGIRHDNRKSELRICDHIKNLMNTKNYTNNTSGRKGVSYDKSRNKWIANIKANGKFMNLGRFSTFEEAVIVREEAEKKYFGYYNPSPNIESEKLSNYIKDITPCNYKKEDNLCICYIKNRKNYKFEKAFVFDMSLYNLVSLYDWRKSKIGIIN